MPFLDHLEELRWRIIWSFLALVVGTVIGFLVVQHYDVLGLLKRPIADLLPEGKLFVTRPAEAFIITLKLALLVGLVIAGPVIAWQTWIFLAPALYEHEKRFVLPTIAAGLVLFLIGAAIAYLWVLPAALKILFSFQREDLEWIITANEYFSFASLFILAFGLVFELPLIMVVLAVFGLVDPALFARNRPIALVISAIVAALLTPPDAFSMMMMLVPLVILYEVGIAVAKMFWRGRRAPRAAATTAAVLGLLIAAGSVAPVPARGQVVQQQQQQRRTTDSTARDSIPRRQPIDTAAARKLGLPSAPSRSFPPPDSILQALMKREGFSVTRYAADSLTLFAPDREIALTGSVLVEREGSTLEADTVRFFQADCRLAAAGEPTLFDQSTVLRGEGMGYNTCEHRGIVAEALTSFNQSGVEWFLRGALAVDSASTRVYARRSSITSSDLPMPDYHFGAGRIKWVTNTIMVARPAVLYVRDVPVLWLPFIFQDMRQGRRSGILVPSFGINDIVRPNRGYRRHVENIGFYLALSDYMDLQASMDWWSGQSMQVNGALQYRWLDRFVTGSVRMSRMYQFAAEGRTGQTSLHLGLNHAQSFDLRTQLNASIDYATSASVLQRNSVDPRLATAALTSAANFNKQFDWGTLVLGGTRSQDLSSGVITQSLPTFNLTPRPINIGSAFTWTPGLSFSNQQTLHRPVGVFDLPPVNGVPGKDSLFVDSRNSRVHIQTPLRIGSWNWPNSFTINDSRNTGRSSIRLPNPADPTDTLTRFYAEDFSTGVDWTTGIGLPILFPATWRLAPRLGIQNATGGDFLVRNRFTEGRFVHQSKRLSFGASVSPTVFGFFPGFGPLLRIRHAVSPGVTWDYAPPGSVPEEYARAIDPEGRRRGGQSPAQHRLTFSLSQTFEAKLRPPAGDTTDERNARKLKLLSVQTSGVAYDFAQAKEPERTGWTTAAVTNSFTSDLLPGFSLSTSHELWDGAVGTDTARFDPFLNSISLRFGVSAQTFGRLLAFVTGGSAPDVGPEPPTQQPAEQQPPLGQTTTGPLTNRPGQRSTDEVAASSFRGGGGLQMSLSYDDQRSRPSETTGTRSLAIQNRTLGLAVGFSPTRNWALSWDTQYNFTTKEFGQHLLRLERDLNRWRATFSFIKSPNGNFGFNFYISLLDQPEIKFQYDQRTVR